MVRVPRAYRTIEHRPTVRRTRAARAAKTWRVVVVWANSRRAPSPRCWPRLGRIDTATGRRLRLWNVAVTAFDYRAARPARASPRGEPANGPRSTCALADLAWLSSRPTRDALHPMPLAEALPHRHRPRSAATASKRLDHLVRISWRAARACFAPWRTEPTAMKHERAVETLRGFLRSQRGARSTPRRWPRLFFTDTAPGRRLRLQNVVVTAFDFRGVQPARASPRGEPADGPRSTRALSDLAWLSSRPTRDALHPTPLAEALLHRHRPRLAAAASERRCHRV